MGNDQLPSARVVFCTLRSSSTNVLRTEHRCAGAPAPRGPRCRGHVGAGARVRHCGASAEVVRAGRGAGADGLVVCRHVRAVRGARVQWSVAGRAAPRVEARGGVRVPDGVLLAPRGRSTAGITPGVACVAVSVPIFSKSWETRSSFHSWPSADDLRLSPPAWIRACRPSSAGFQLVAISARAGPIDQPVSEPPAVPASLTALSAGSFMVRAMPSQAPAEARSSAGSTSVRWDTCGSSQFLVAVRTAAASLRAGACTGCVRRKRVPVAPSCPNRRCRP